MNTFPSAFWLGKRWAVVFAILTLFCAAPTPAYGGGGRVFFGGRGFAGGRGFFNGLAFGVGVGLGQRIFYSPPSYYAQPNVVLYSNPAPIYYVQQPSPQSVTVVTAPAPTVQPQPSQVPVAVSSGGKLSKILYDANAKPIGVLVLNNDGTQEFVPLAQ